MIRWIREFHSGAGSEKLDSSQYFTQQSAPHNRPTKRLTCNDRPFVFGTALRASCRLATNPGPKYKSPLWLSLPIYSHQHSTAAKASALSPRVVSLILAAPLQH